MTRIVPDGFLIVVAMPPWIAVLAQYYGSSAAGLKQD